MLTTLCNDILFSIVSFLSPQEVYILKITHLKFLSLKNKYKANHIRTKYAIKHKSIPLIKIIQQRKIININKHIHSILRTNNYEFVSYLLELNSYHRYPIAIYNNLNNLNSKIIVHVMRNKIEKRILRELFMSRYDVIDLYIKMGMESEIDYNENDMVDWVDEYDNVCIDALKILYKHKNRLSSQQIYNAIYYYKLEDLKWVFGTVNKEYKQLYIALFYFDLDKYYDSIPLENILWLYTEKKIKIGDINSLFVVNNLSHYLQPKDKSLEVTPEILIHRASLNIFSISYISSFNLTMNQRLKIIYYAVFYDRPDVYNDLFFSNISVDSIVTLCKMKNFNRVMYFLNTKKSQTFTKDYIIDIVNSGEGGSIMDIMMSYKDLYLCDIIKFYMYGTIDLFHHIVSKRKYTYNIKNPINYTRFVYKLVDTISIEDQLTLEIFKEIHKQQKMCIQDKHIIKYGNLNLIKYFNITNTKLMYLYGNKEMIDYANELGFCTEK